MKKTFEFRYYQDKVGDWHLKRKWILLGLIPLWIHSRSYDRSWIRADEQEAEILAIIKWTIDHEKRLASHKNIYRTVDENFFNKIS